MHEKLLSYNITLQWPMFSRTAKIRGEAEKKLNFVEMDYSTNGIDIKLDKRCISK